MRRRRRPLLRAAAVGGTAYAMGKHGQRSADQEAAQNEQIADLQQPVPQQPTGSGAAPATGSTGRIEALKQLKELLDAGVLSQEEFESEKQKVLSTA